MRKSKTILGMRVDVSSLPSAVSILDNFVRQGIGRYVCVSNVHMCMESFDDINFRELVNASDLVVPDGKPLFWAQSLLGVKDANQVRGMDLMLTLCEHAAKEGFPIGLYGATSVILSKLEKNLQDRFMGIQIVSVIAPPFRALTAQENDQYINQITDAGVRILFVGIGCPKQERWMAENKSNLNCVMLGVGAAFDFIAGQKRHAPDWMQAIGLEWLFRLLCEPRRLWKRYMKQNPRFVWYFLKQLLSEKIKSKK